LPSRLPQERDSKISSQVSLVLVGIVLLDYESRRILAAISRLDKPILRCGMVNIAL
jgi:hypothetical protein